MIIIKILSNFISLAISIFIPKSNKYIVVGGWYGKRYADNSRGIYEYIRQNKENLGIKKVFWFTRDRAIFLKLKEKGFDVLYGCNLISIFYHYRSKIHIIDQSPKDIIRFTSVRCKRVQLWHGIGMKKIGVMSTKNSNILKKVLLDLSSCGFWNNFYVCASSPLTANFMAESWGVPKDKCLIVSHPRAKLFYEKYNNYNGNGLFNVYYLPTFRNNESVSPLLEMDLNVLNNLFEINNINFFVKPHFADKALWDADSDRSNIHLIDAAEDVNLKLPYMDLLITDYSTAFYDFLLTGKAVLFFCYDLDYYKNIDRGFLVDYEKFTPGDKIFNKYDLIDRIIYIKENYSEYIAKYKQQYDWVNHQMNYFTTEYNLSALDRMLRQ